MKHPHSKLSSYLERRPALTVAFLLVVFSWPSLTAQIFVTAFPGERIEVADLDGRNHRVLLDMDRAFGPSDYRPLCVTVSGSSLYWTDTKQGAIYTAFLDGRNARKLVDLEESFGTEHDAFPFGLAVTDSALFWAEVGWPMGIYTAGLRGSDPRRLFGEATGAGPLFYRPNEVVVSGSRVFWTGEWNDIGKVFAANLGGGSPVVVADTSTRNNYGLTVLGDRLYWTNSLDSAPATIESAKLDGSDVRTLINLDRIFGSDASPWKITAAGSNIYWVDHNLGGVFTARLDGRSPRKLFDTFGARPDSVAVVINPPPPPAHPFIITEVRTVADAPFFQRTWRVTWNSDVGETYRVLVSDDMETWLPANETWVADDIETQADILLPANMPQAFFRVERQ